MPRAQWLSAGSVRRDCTIYFPALLSRNLLSFSSEPLVRHLLLLAGHSPRQQNPLILYVAYLQSMWWRDADDGERSSLLSGEETESAFGVGEDVRPSSPWRSRIGERGGVRIFAATVLTVAVVAVFRSGGPAPAASIVGAGPLQQFAIGTTSTAACTSRDVPVLGGADVVAYFSGRVAFDQYVPGRPAYKATLNGFTFLFANDAHRVMFAADPWRFAPQWGAFCSWGVARENWWSAEDIAAPADPLKWLILGGKLYMFRSNTPISNFEGDGTDDIAYNVGEGNKHWADWFGAIPSNRSPFNTGCLCTPDTCSDDLSDRRRGRI
ncbi:unnamed protein product [Phaeothamnion confervicola]